MLLSLCIIQARQPGADAHLVLHIRSATNTWLLIRVFTCSAHLVRRSVILLQEVSSRSGWQALALSHVVLRVSLDCAGLLAGAYLRFGVHRIIPIYRLLVDLGLSAMNRLGRRHIFTTVPVGSLGRSGRLRGAGASALLMSLSRDCFGFGLKDFVLVSRHSLSFGIQISVDARFHVFEFACRVPLHQLLSDALLLRCSLVGCRVFTLRCWMHRLL